MTKERYSSKKIKYQKLLQKAQRNHEIKLQKKKKNDEIARVSHTRRNHPSFRNPKQKKNENLPRKHLKIQISSRESLLQKKISSEINRIEGFCWRFVVFVVFILLSKYSEREKNKRKNRKRGLFFPSSNIKRRYEQI